MKTLAIGFLLPVLAVQAAVWPPARQWSVAFPGHYFVAAGSAPDGGAVVTLSEQDDESIISFAKVSPNGTVAWQRCVQDHWSNDPDESAVVATGDGGLLGALTVGARESFEGTCSFVTRTNPVIGAYDCWLARLDANGSKLWDRTLGGTSYDYVTRLYETPDGGFLLLAQSESPASGNKSSSNFGSADIWLVRLNAQGAILWDRSFGGSGWDAPRGLALLPDGGCVVAGYSLSPASGNKTSTSTGPWVFRVDGDGQKLWDYSYVPGGAYSADAIRLLPDGRLMFVGDNSVRQISADGLVVTNWSFAVSGSIYRALTTPDGGVIGQSSSGLARWNHTNVVWSMTNQLDDTFYLESESRAGGFIHTIRGSFNAWTLAQAAPDVFTARPALSRPSPGTGGTGTITVHGVPNHTYAVERTFDFANWLPVSTNLLASNSLPVAFSSTNPAAWFRARLVP